jgi:hypothetical protein
VEVLLLFEVVDAALALTFAIISFVLADEIELIVERSIKNRLHAFSFANRSTDGIHSALLSSLLHALGKMKAHCTNI